MMEKRAEFHNPGVHSPMVARELGSCGSNSRRSLPKFISFAKADRSGCIRKWMAHKGVLIGGRRIAIAAMGTAALFLCSHAMGQTIVWPHESKLTVSPSPKSGDSTQKVVWSPDHELYAVDFPGEQVGKGQERERLEIFTERGEKVAVAHVWLIEPDGTNRAGKRGCESWGWVDSTRLFCEGTINPDYGDYLVFDARSGRELWELIGTGFVWSPDGSRIANVGDARDLGTVSENSNSIEVQGEPVFPSKKDTDLHRFRSALVWSADSCLLGVVDHREKEGSFYLIVVGVSGRSFEHKLDWQENKGDWPPELDFSVRWVGRKIIVTHGGTTQTVTVAR
jgi:hypothetical protein